MNQKEMKQAIIDLLAAAWISGGLTLEQKSTDSADPNWITKYFNEKDDADLGGHWNVVSGGTEWRAFMLKTFGADGALTFPQFCT